MDLRPSEATLGVASPDVPSETELTPAASAIAGDSYTVLPRPKTMKEPLGSAGTPAATASPATAVPTIDRGAVRARVDAAFERIQAGGREPLCVRWVDVDADGAAEWVGLYVAPAASGQGLGAFVLDGESWHELEPIAQSKHGLGEHPICTLDVLDVNVDGRQEILVWGYAASNVDLLHLFAWDGSSYELVAPFEGSAGIHLEDWDGSPGEEIVVGHRVTDDLVWQVVYVWDGVAYGWTWDRHAWYYLKRPHAYDTTTPERAVISFYMAIDDRDLPGAFHLLAAGAPDQAAYEEWAAAFATTVGAEASAVQKAGAPSADGSRKVSAQVLARDNVDGRIIATFWDVVWSVVSTENGWRLQSATSQLLRRSELAYFP